jgi:glycosyltransferase involved in cell wall biosynthesis
MKGVSIIICCYNSEKLLPETLKHISLQKVSETLRWEVIIVNNNSSDKTKEIAREEWGKYSHSENCSFRIVDEPNPGLSNARKKGIECSIYDVLIYCDDDNWLCEDYVQTAYNSILLNETTAIIGGCGEPVFENNYKPEWFDVFAPVYALGTQKPEINKYVYGAGMVIKKKSLQNLYNAGFENILTDRNGTILSAGGDTELCFALVLLGYNIEYNSKLKFKHFLPEKRLSYEYLKRMYKGFAKASIVVKIYDHFIKERKINSPFLLTLYFFIYSLLTFFYRQLKPENTYKKNIMRIYDITKIKDWSKNFSEIKKIKEYIQSIKTIKQNII